MRVDTKANPTPVLVGDLNGGAVVVWEDGPRDSYTKCALWLVVKYKVGIGKGENDNATRFVNLESGETASEFNASTTRNSIIRVVHGAFVEGYTGEAE